MSRTIHELRKRRHRRVRQQVSGTAGRPRVAVSRSIKNISAQIIDDGAGRTIASASSLEPTLKGVDGGNVAGAKRVAELLAERARAAGVTSVVFDRGGFAYHGRVAAFADSLRAGGLEF
jgi:large subunit ribosomal protein L18